MSKKLDPDLLRSYMMGAANPVKGSKTNSSMFGEEIDLHVDSTRFKGGKMDNKYAIEFQLEALEAARKAPAKRPIISAPEQHPKKQRTKRTKEADEVTTHEEANIRKMAESVKCSVCPNVWFSRSSLINKFGLDITEVSNDPAWTCPHCAGECSLCSCVRKRENMVAGQIETRLSGVNYTNDPDIKPPALSYVQWIRRAKAASHASVRAYVAEAWPEMKW